MGSTFTGLLAALVALKAPSSAVGIGAAVLAAVAYAVMTAASMVIFFGFAWRTGPNLEQLERDRKDNGWTELETKWVAFTTLRSDYTSNKGAYGWRLVGLRIIAVSLGLETLLLAFLALSLALAAGSSPSS